MADFPYAEYAPESTTRYEMPSMEAEAFRTVLRGALLPTTGFGGLFGRMRSAPSAGFARLRGAFGVRQAAEEAKAVRVSDELAEMLRKLGGKPGPSDISRPGALAEAARRGQIDRPWVGTKSIYQTEGSRVVPPSYTRPRTYTLEE